MHYEHLKIILWNYMRKVKRYRHVDVLQDMVKLYNDMLHQSIGMKPSEVTKGHLERRLWWHQYKPKESYKKSKKLHLKRGITCVYLTMHGVMKKVDQRNI